MPDVPSQDETDERVVTVGAVALTDEYRWLRHDTAEVRAWQARENAATSALLHRSEHVERVRAALDEGLTAPPTTAERLGATTPRRLGAFWFRLAAVPDDDAVLGLWVSEEVDGPRRLLVDPRDAVFAREGSPAQLLWYEPAADGSRVVFAAYPSGRSTGPLHVVETGTGRRLPVEAPPHTYAGATPAWLPRGEGFYTADRTAAGEHRMRFVPVEAGTPAEPDSVFGPGDLPSQTFALTAQVSPDGSRIVALTGQHEQVAAHLMDRATGRWRPFLPEGYPGECHGGWFDDDTYVAVATGHAPRGRLVAIPVVTSTDESTWRELLPESDAVLRCVRRLGDDLVVCEMRDIAVEFRVLSAAGEAVASVPMPELGSSPTAALVRRFERSTELTLAYETFLRPLTHHRYDPATNALLPLADNGPRAGDLTVHRRFATSHDGTRVPYVVVHRSDLDTGTPQSTLVEAYGGYNVALMPRFLGCFGPFLDAGGVYVQANVRGGAEYGREWYEAGRLAHKQNTYDDLAAVAEELVATGVTTADRAAFYGHSNGGITAEVTVLQRPDLWAGVVADAPLSDLLEPHSAGNPAAAMVREVVAEDFGDVTDPADPAAATRVAAFSPYHNVRVGRRYPPLLQIFGEYDAACEPFHGRILTARLRAASSANAPLLRVREGYGHVPMTRAQAVEHYTEINCFLLATLAMTPTV